MPRFLTAAALGAVLAAGAAAPALAQPARPHRFVASLKADVVTRWEEPSWTTEECHVRTVAEASGEERERIRTTPIRVRVMPAGRDVAFAYGSPRTPLGGMPAKGSVTAEHTIYADHSPGACAFDGYAPPDVEDTHQCRDPHVRWTVQMVSADGRLAPSVVPQASPGAMGSCTIYRPDDAASAWAGSGVRVPVGEIRDAGQEYVVLRGRKQVRQSLVLDAAGGHVRTLSTTVRWTLRMRRAT